MHGLHPSGDKERRQHAPLLEEVPAVHQAEDEQGGDETHGDDDVPGDDTCKGEGGGILTRGRHCCEDGGLMQ